MRFYLDISDRLRIRDEVGCNFKLVLEEPLYTQNTWLLTYDGWNPIPGPGYLFR